MKCPECKYENREDAYSKLAQISQLPQEFDFPRENLSPSFHYTGPLQNPSGIESITFPDIAFPWEKLTDKPLIYASLGTLQNKVPEIFQCIAAATAELDAQLVAESIASQLVRRVAGMNTTLGALSSGVPIVAIPITSEQPGIANRIAMTGAGEVIKLKKLSVPKLKATVERVLTENSYKQNADRLQEAIRRAGGIRKAADIIEQVSATKKPVVTLKE